jgi:phospholipase/lecithinase/hemolysin
MRILNWLIASLLFVSLTATAGHRNVSPYDVVYAFGDSLTDDGHLHPDFPPPPYAEGRFSNGHVAVEYLADESGIGLVDFAVAGATTGTDNPDLAGTDLANTGVRSQVGFYLSSATVADPNGLYFVLAGANDLLNALTFPTPNPQKTIQATINEAVNNIVSEVKALHKIGANHIMVANLPNLGLTPSVRALGSDAQTLATYASVAFNKKLAFKLPEYVQQFDTFTTMSNVVNNPANYHLTNVTDPCFDGANVCSDPNQYLYWDDLHPTTAVHNIIGHKLYEQSVLLDQH